MLDATWPAKDDEPPTPQTAARARTCAWRSRPAHTNTFHNGGPPFHPARREGRLYTHRP